MTDRSPIPRSVRRAVIAGLALAALATALVVYRPWEGILYGRVDPPAPDTAGLDRALAQRIAHRTAEVKADPYSASAWGRLAAVYHVHEIFPEAIACYERAERLDPDAFRWPYFLGLCTLVGDQRAAQEHFLRALTLNEQYPPLHVHLGRGFLAADEIDVASVHFRRASDLEPGMIRAHLGLASVALARDEPGTAVSHLEAALALEPAEGEVHWLLSEAHRRLGHDDLAEEHRRRAADRTLLEPVDDPLLMQIAWEEGVTLRWRKARSQEHVRAGRIDLLLDEWDEAVEADPGSAPARAFRGEALARLGRPDEAIAELRRALEIDPSLMWARVLLANYLLGRDRPEEGVTELERVCAEQPANAEAQYTLGLALSRLGRLDEALEPLRRAVEIDPRRLAARVEYGTALVEAGRFDEGIEILEAVVEAAPRSDAAALRLAWALGAAERPAEAVAALRAARERAPESPRLAQELAWALATLPDAALRDGAEALSLIAPLAQGAGARDPFLLDSLAAACAETGDFDAAVRHLLEALRQLDSPQAPLGGPEGAALRADLTARLELYRAGRPYRQE